MNFYGFTQRQQTQERSSPSRVHVPAMGTLAGPAVSRWSGPAPVPLPTGQVKGQNFFPRTAPVRLLAESHSPLRSVVAFSASIEPRQLWLGLVLRALRPGQGVKVDRTRVASGKIYCNTQRPRFRYAVGRRSTERLLVKQFWPGMTCMAWVSRLLSGARAFLLRFVHYFFAEKMVFSKVWSYAAPDSSQSHTANPKLGSCSS